jgi:hypothetical protein
VFIATLIDHINSRFPPNPLLVSFNNLFNPRAMPDAAEVEDPTYRLSDLDRVCDRYDGITLANFTSTAAHYAAVSTAAAADAANSAMSAASAVRAISAGNPSTAALAADAAYAAVVAARTARAAAAVAGAADDGAQPATYQILSKKKARQEWAVLKHSLFRARQESNDKARAVWLADTSKRKASEPHRWTMQAAATWLMDPTRASMFPHIATLCMCAMSIPVWTFARLPAESDVC